MKLTWSINFQTNRQGAGGSLDILQTGSRTGQSFRTHLSWPSTTCSRQTEFPLPCRHPALLPEMLLAPHSQSAAFQAPGNRPGTGHHPGCYRPSRFSFGLRLTSHVGKRCYPQPFAVCARGHLGHSFRTPLACDFSVRTRKIRLPNSKRFFPVRQPVSCQTHLQALSRLSSLSSSPPCFQGRRSAVYVPIPYVAVRQVPTQATLHRPNGIQAPWAGFSPALNRSSLNQGSRFFSVARAP